MWIHQGNPKKTADKGKGSKRNVSKRRRAHKNTTLYQSSKAAEECEKMWIIRVGWPNMGEAGWAKERWSKDLAALLVALGLDQDNFIPTIPYPASSSSLSFNARIKVFTNSVSFTLQG